MEKLSKNFSREEFACRCCGKVRVSHILVKALQKLRDLAGCPIHVTSGYRCYQHNKAVGGVPNSYHLVGLAADIISRNHSPRQLRRLAKKIPEFYNGGIGLYKSFIHVDVRGKKARW